MPENNESTRDMNAYSDANGDANAIAQAVALDVLAGFERHYFLFCEGAKRAKQFFEARQWLALQHLSRERIDYYDERVRETVADLWAKHGQHLADERVWTRIKTDYVTLLAEHLQPELAETFFNSVVTKVLHRDYFHNRFLFVRPAVSTEYVESNPPSYRVYYPAEGNGLVKTLLKIVLDLGLQTPFVNLRRDVRYVLAAARAALPRPFRVDADCQIQVLAQLFFRNKGAYLIGRLINGNMPQPFAIPILHNEDGRLYLDTVLFQVQHIATLFSFTRAYFLVDMQAPSAYVQFLRSLLPIKPKAELYTMLGLHKQGKTLFYRDFLHHLEHSHDSFEIAPGIKGLVMAVFTLPSYPYVFKIIKDTIAPSKDIDAHGVKQKYQLVKWHDRVGRMADTWEYSQVGLPVKRFSAELLQHLQAECAQSLEFEGDVVVLKHVYIERRMMPLNLYLQQATPAQVEHGVLEYGNAIKQLAAANIFPGDMLFKNFGVTRLGRVVFYDYDEIEYMLDCQFRRIPPAPNPEAELSSEPWYSVGPKDVFPEQFGPFLLGDSRVREAFLKHHADLLTYEFWQGCKERIAKGHVEDIFPYPQALRFVQRF